MATAETLPTLPFSYLDDTNHADEVLAQYEPLVLAMTRRFSHNGVDVDILAQAGRAAVLRASSRFDPTRGEFNPYARKSVKHALIYCVNAHKNSPRDLPFSELRVFEEGRQIPFEQTIKDIPAEEADDIKRPGFSRSLENFLHRIIGPKRTKILQLRFGIGTDHPHELREIGPIFGISYEWVRQHEIAAMDILRQPSTLRKLRQLAKDYSYRFNQEYL